MPKAPKFSFGEILHTVAVRILVSGSGNLDLSLASLNEFQIQNLFPITMNLTSNRQEPTQLANFVDQYTQIQFMTNAINEVFTISKIIAFVKPYGAEYPR